MTSLVHRTEDSVPKVLDSQKPYMKQANEEMKGHRKQFLSVWKSVDLEMYFLYLSCFSVVFLFFPQNLEK